MPHRCDTAVLSLTAAVPIHWACGIASPCCNVPSETGKALWPGPPVDRRGSGSPGLILDTAKTSKTRRQVFTRDSIWKKCVRLLTQS